MKKRSAIVFKILKKLRMNKIVFLLLKPIIQMNGKRKRNEYDDFDWRYYELDSNESNYKYMVIVEQPINPAAYLLDKDLKVDSTIIIGDGVLGKNNIYFTEQLKQGPGPCFIWKA